MPDSDSSHAAEYKSFRQISRDRLLHEMLRSAKRGEPKQLGRCSSWTRLLSKLCHILARWQTSLRKEFLVRNQRKFFRRVDFNITFETSSLVEDIYKRRQPLPSMDAIYFIQPLKENVVMFLSDMSGRYPLYKKAHVFFSSPIPKDLVAHIKNDTSVLLRIGALGEGFIADHERVLEELFKDNAENSRNYDACLNMMASRIATVFASLRELPFVRYRAAGSPDASTVTTLRDLVPTKLASAVLDCLAKYKSTIQHFPQTETCHLLIVDRSVDQIAPVIHEWTYDAMCHDLLNMEGNKYKYEVTTKPGTTEKKEVLLEDHDPVWLELHYAHIADASERLHDKMTNFVSKNKAAQLLQGSRGGSELFTRELQKMVQALP